LLDEPTRGIDVGSKIELYAQMDAAAQRGCAILMTSSYLPELQGICDRIAVMNRGRLVALHDARTVEAATLMADSIQ
jgi:ribose transport system ATP-binding protein